MNYKSAMVGATKGTPPSEATIAMTGGTHSSKGPSNDSQNNSAVSLTESSLQITIHKLNGKNYLEWSQSVRLVIDGKGKLGCLNGEV